MGREHRLNNYRSVMIMPTAVARTVMVESYVVDVPAWNTMEDMRVFVDMVVKCNLQSLARTVESLVKREVVEFWQL
ncbi:putative START-like domain superfamily protein [Dioscorea sansibarensis]